jgi:hypothetical protein
MGGYGGEMGKLTTGNTPATEFAFDRLTELVLSDEPEYPNDTCLLPADAPDFGKMIADSLLDGTPLLIVYPDGRERFIPAPSKALPRRS